MKVIRIFEVHRDGTPALWLSEDESKVLYLNDANTSIEVTPDIDVYDAVKQWRESVAK